MNKPTQNIKEFFLLTWQYFQTNISVCINYLFTMENMCIFNKSIVVMAYSLYIMASGLHSISCLKNAKCSVSP